jgi:hypothetical protein
MSTRPVKTISVEFTRPSGNFLKVYAPGKFSTEMHFSKSTAVIDPDHLCLGPLHALDTASLSIESDTLKKVTLNFT